MKRIEKKWMVAWLTEVSAKINSCAFFEETPWRSSTSIII